MDNQKIAQVFQEISDILDIEGANRFRIIAYQRAVQNILNFPRELRDVYQEDPKLLQEIPGIGKDLALKIEELVTTGKCAYHQELLKKFDRGLLDILRVRGIGPKKVKLFFSELRIDSIEKLRQAAMDGQLRELPGMGPKSEAEILKALQDYDKHQERMVVSEALRQVQGILDYLKKCPDIQKVEYAGSLRRMRETIGDLDILCAVKPKEKTEESLQEAALKVMDYFVAYPENTKILAKGDTKSSILLHSGIQADLRVIDEKIFGAALHYFTGSKAHNVALRDRAKKMGLKINEYGVFRLKKVSGKKEAELVAEASEKGNPDVEAVLIGGKTEQEVFEAVGLPYIIPEMREDRGEIEAALDGKLPKPLGLKDLKGDLHVHSRWSDGSNEIEEIARSYRDAGFEYIALTDHSPSMAVAHGLTPERFAMQWDEIDALNAEFAKEAGKGAPPFIILKGVECDILPNGKMDLPDEVLAQMDVVIASVHSRFNLSEKEQTERVLKAFENPYVKIFGHPSGRLINEREPYALDFERVIDAAIRLGIALEINSQPNRLDLFDYYCKMAKDRGAKFVVDSDSHHFEHKRLLTFGVAVARRGWVEKKDVLNCLNLKEFLKALRK